MFTMLSLPNRANVQTCLQKTRNNHEDSGGKKHVSSNQAHVVSSNQPIQKRFNVANPGLTKPGFLVIRQIYWMTRGCCCRNSSLLVPKIMLYIYILYYMYIYIIYPMNIWLLVWNIWIIFFHSVVNVIIPTDELNIFQRGRYTTNQILIPIKIPLDAHEIIMKSP